TGMPAPEATPTPTAKPGDVGLPPLPPLNGLVPPPVSPGADVKALQPVYYATDRKSAAPGTPLDGAFTADRSMSISYGLSIVSVPKNHTIGNVERPQFGILRLGREAETDADH